MTLLRSLGHRSRVKGRTTLSHGARGTAENIPVAKDDAAPIERPNLGGVTFDTNFAWRQGPEGIRLGAASFT